MHLTYPNIHTQGRKSNWKKDTHKGKQAHERTQTVAGSAISLSVWPSDELVKSDTTKDLITEPFCGLKPACII